MNEEKNNADCCISAVNPVKHLITMQKIHPHIQKIEGGKGKKEGGSTSNPNPLQRSQYYAVKSPCRIGTVR